MNCFSLGLIEQLFIAAVILIAVYLIIEVLLPLITTHAKGAVATFLNILIQIIKIVFWAAVAIVCIKFAFEMISCLWSSMPSLTPHR